MTGGRLLGRVLAMQRRLSDGLLPVIDMPGRAIAGGLLAGSSV